MCKILNILGYNDKGTYSNGCKYLFLEIIAWIELLYFFFHFAMDLGNFVIGPRGGSLIVKTANSKQQK